jgi:pseudouridine-5'-phosphate glycosidase
LGKAKDVAKVSRRDIPFVLSKKLNGATTVAATMIIADLANIKVFATGGIGGVHRRAQETFDISADLTELSKTNVAVVCAGAKSILDIGLTLEVLETLGVASVGYQTDDFPAFYTRKSGFGVDYRCDTPEEIAKALKIKWDLGLNGGIIIANPVPKVSEIDPELINGAIESALSESLKLNITGKRVTPFLLSKIKDITDGKSLETNIALVKNNAELAARIAANM